MLGGSTISIVMLGNDMLSDEHLVFYFICLHAECHYAEGQYHQFCYAGCSCNA